MNNTKKVFLLTAEQRKPYHIQNLKARYKEQITFVNSIGEAEFVLCIGIKEKDRAELLQAQEMGIRVAYFSEEMLPEQMLQNTLKMENACHVVKDEIAFSREEMQF